MASDKEVVECARRLTLDARVIRYACRRARQLRHRFMRQPPHRLMHANRVIASCAPTARDVTARGKRVARNPWITRLTLIRALKARHDSCVAISKFSIVSRLMPRFQRLSVSRNSSPGVAPLAFACRALGAFISRLTTRS